MKSAKLFLFISLTSSTFLAAQAITVDDAWAAAEKNNLTLALRASEFRAAQAGVDEARSRLWPTLGFSSSGTYLTNPQSGITIPSGSLGSAPNPGAKYPSPLPGTDIVLVPDPLHTYFKLQGTLNWPVFTWGKITEAIQVAQNQLSLAGLQERKTKEETRRDLRKAYFGIILARESVNLLTQMEGLTQGLMDDRRNNFAQGTVNKEAVLEMQGRLSDLRFQKSKAEQGLRTALQGFQLLTGLTVSPEQLDQSPRKGSPALNLTDLTALAWKVSSDRKILERQQAMAVSGEKIQKASGPFRPDIGLNIQLELAGQAIPYSANWYDTWNPNVTISLGTSGSVFDGFQNSAKVRSASERVEQTELGLKLLEQGNAIQVQQKVEAVVNATGTLASKSASRELAVERSRNAEVAFDNELATREESQGATLGALFAEIEYLAAEYQMEAALCDLEYLTGTTLTD